MSFLSNLNFASTVVSFGCISFAASNFGIKFGRAITFKNTSGYKLVSESENSEKLYEEIAKDAKEEGNAPEWAKNAYTLKKWCNKNQAKARKWRETSKYCLLKNNVRHQLIAKGYKIKEKSEGTTSTATSAGDTKTVTTNNECTKEVFNSYADDTGSSVGFLFALSKCVEHKLGDSTQSAHSQGTGAARS